MRAGEGAATEACRIDLWLWRARFFKTRALACRFVEGGGVRLLRAGAQTRLDKASRSVRPGDGLVFAIGGRLLAIQVQGVGERRGPAEAARALYSPLDQSSGGQASGRGARHDPAAAGASPGSHDSTL